MNFIHYNQKSSNFLLSSASQPSGSMVGYGGGMTIAKTPKVPIRCQEKVQKKTSVTPRKYTTTETWTRTVEINRKPGPTKRKAAACKSKAKTSKGPTVKRQAAKSGPKRKSGTTSVQRKSTSYAQVSKKARVEEYSSEYSSSEDYSSDESCYSDSSSYSSEN